MNSARFSAGGAFEIEHELLEFLRHGVESRGQFADLGAALQLTRWEKSPRAMARLDCGEHFQRIGDAAGGKDADADAQQHSQQSPAGGRVRCIS